MTSPTSIKRFGDERDWFFEKRFGLFVHWGLYSLGEWHEQEQWRWPRGQQEYRDRYLSQFNPKDWQPDAWLDLMEEAGMEYICLTTKHCDGFCLWDTDTTDYKATNTPAGRDLVGDLAEACQRRGVPLCLYMSIPDLHCPLYPHAGNPYELEKPVSPDASWDAYLEYLLRQVEELGSRYGKIHGLWWDANVQKIKTTQHNDLFRKLQPAAVINNRGFDPGDFGTPERDWDDSVDELAVFQEPTEACQAVGHYSWCYKTDEDYYTPLYFQQSVAKLMAKGGNYLLNVGPKADGTMPEEGAEIVRQTGAWFKKVKPALVDATPLPGYTARDGFLLTRQGDSLFVIIHQAPAVNAINLRPIGLSPLKATMLNTGEPVTWTVNRLPGYGPMVDAEPTLRLRELPFDLANTVPVIQLDFAPGELETLRPINAPAGSGAEFMAE